LVHRDEVDPRVALDERLRPVAVVHIPVDDQDALEAMTLAGIVGRDGNVAEQAEPHRLITERMVAWGADGAEAPRRAAVKRPVYTIQHTTYGRCRGRK
jgi:hypothetical protein